MILPDFPRLVLYFVIYSSVGWLCECIWCAIGTGRLVNRGFLSGPWCPVYGFGALLILLCTTPVAGSPAAVFVIAVVAASTLEYFTGWLLETLFQTRWWDYSSRPFNLKGRVCLRNSLMFGIMGLGLTFLIHPVVQGWVLGMGPDLRRVLSGLLMAVLIVDLARALAQITHLQERLAALKTTMEELGQYQQRYAWYDKSDIPGSVDRLRRICESPEADSAASGILARLDALARVEHRILEAFPRMRHKTLGAELEALRRTWLTRRKDAEARAGRRLAAVAEAYSGLTAVHLIWLFLGCSLMGYVLETGYRLALSGGLQSGQTLVFGPLNLTYGVALLLITLAALPLGTARGGRVFLLSAVVGSVCELLLTLLAELALGAAVRPYSASGLALFAGRMSAPRILFWGVAGLVFVRALYPRACRFITSLPSRPRVFFTWIIVACLVVGIAVSALAVGRWAGRSRGSPPANPLSALIDTYYPDEIMESIYPYVHIEQGGAE